MRNEPFILRGPPHSKAMLIKRVCEKQKVEQTNPIRLIASINEVYMPGMCGMQDDLTEMNETVPQIFFFFFF